MSENFVAPCTKNYGCSEKDLTLYARDNGKVDFVRCKSCGLIWRDLSTCNEEGNYDSQYFQIHNYDRRRQHRINKAHMLLSIVEEHIKPGRMLEVGPGLGYNMEAAIERGWKSQGLDVSDYAVKFARIRGLNVSQGSLTDCPAFEGSFDLIFMKHVLEHYRDPFEALTQARALLSNRGLIGIVVPNALYKKAVNLRSGYRFYSYEGKGVEHFVYFDRGTLRKILEHTGFELLQEGLPVLVNGDNSAKSLANRILRRSMSLFDLDKELFAVARRTD